METLTQLVHQLPADLQMPVVFVVGCVACGMLATFLSKRI